MRLFIVGTALLFSISTTAAAQSRWTFSAGPEWEQFPQSKLWGLRLRAEYDLTKPTSIFGLRLEGGARWGPTQGYFFESGPFRVRGSEQRMDLMLGLSGGLSPFPRARFSPYVTMGIFGRQKWMQGSSFDYDSTKLSWDAPYSSSTNGDIMGTLGVGVRARLAGRSFQLELRRVHSYNGLTFGTRLPF